MHCGSNSLLYMGVIQYMTEYTKSLIIMFFCHLMGIILFKQLSTKYCLLLLARISGSLHCSPAFYGDFYLIKLLAFITIARTLVFYANVLYNVAHFWLTWPVAMQATPLWWVWWVLGTKSCLPQAPSPCFKIRIWRRLCCWLLPLVDT